MSRLLLLLSFVTLTQFLQAQICSTPQAPLLDRIEVNKKNMLIQQRGAFKYIPITFHLVANSDGNGRVQEEDLFRQLCSLNAQYADQEVIFYIDRLNYFNHTTVFETPASSAATTQMRIRQDNNSINVFITNKADSGNGGPGETLAYYDPQEDWIVSKKNQINGLSKSLAHELGHFFSLPHPHAGWDCHPYTDEEYGNPITVDYTIPCEGGGGSTLIELQNGSNCAIAGDKICDTPPDYNIGLLHQSGCAPNNSIKDKNGQIITPIVTNIMSYYMECDTYNFTQTQKNLMNTDYFTIQRNYIRTGKVPDTDTVEGPVAYLTPINGQLTSGDTDIFLDWEDTPGATHYMVIIDRFQSFTFNPQKFFVTESELLIDSLTLLSNYYWKVWPYNESRTCAGYSATQNFVVGPATAVKEIDDVNGYVLSPNPISSDESAYLTLSTTREFDAVLSIADATGHVLSRESLNVSSGVTRHPLKTQELPGGIYFIMLHAENGVMVERLFILD